MKILVIAADHVTARSIAISFGLAGHDVSVANDDVSAANLAMNQPDGVLFSCADSHAITLLRNILGDRPVFIVAGASNSAGVDSHIRSPLNVEAAEELFVRLHEEKSRCSA